MKRLSFVNKLTLWYSIILLIIAVGSMTVLSEMGKQRVEDVSVTALVEQVSDIENKIVASGRDFEFGGKIRFYSNDVYLSIYDEGGRLIEGRWPAAVSENPAFEDGRKQKVRDNDGNEWYVYDSICTVEGRTLWIRGITSGKYDVISSGFVWQTALVVLLALLVAAVVIGRIIALRSLKPIRNVVSTVEEIRSSGDLSKRVEVKNRDDLGQLADNFNKLFDKVESMVDKEKQFTSDISHELKTPLAVIVSQSEYALEDREYAETALRTINSEAKRMSDMISRLRLLAGSDSNNLRLNRESVNLSELCCSIVEQQKIIGKSRGVEITGNIEDNVTVSADTTMIIRAILNLVDNGIKYAGEGSRVELSLRKEGREAVCCVSDNGPGINPENTEKIWDRFYREDKSRSGRDSCGLGLSMVKAIVEAHGGSVSVVTAPGEGCVFTIKLNLM